MYQGFVFSVDVAGFSLGSVYTDEWVAQLLRCGEAAAVWGFSASVYGTKVKKKKSSSIGACVWAPSYMPLQTSDESVLIIFKTIT